MREGRSTFLKTRGAGANGRVVRLKRHPQSPCTADNFGTPNVSLFLSFLQGASAIMLKRCLKRAAPSQRHAQDPVD